MKFVVPIALTFFMSLVTSARAATAPLARILPKADAYLRTEMRARSIPGLAVAVVRDGRVVAAQTYGLANIELNVPVTLESVFAIASLDKQLTATGIMLLVEDGKVGLDDEISRYFVDAPAAWKGIRVRHLLSHTSGLPDEVEPLVEGRAFTRYTTEQLLSNIKQQQPLFPPGGSFEYSDAGFLLAQLITEKASGVPWRTFIAQRVFTPAGMTAATFMDAAPVIRNRVAGYALSHGEIVSDRRTSIDYGPLYNDVGTTVIEFANWAAALETNRVLPQSVRDLMWTPQVRTMNAFLPHAYGFGWAIDSFHGVRVMLHAGATGVGIAAVPEYHVSVIVFTNLDNRFGNDTHNLALSVAGFYVPAISLLAMPAKTDPDPARTQRIRDALAQLIRGEPELTQYAPDLVPHVPAIVRGLASRTPYIGQLLALAYLNDELEEGENWLYYRADFSNGRLFVRVCFDPLAKISDLQLVHL
jgi:CubicO group peptidase (beta-lactamase class C family)